MLNSFISLTPVYLHNSADDGLIPLTVTLTWWTNPTPHCQRLSTAWFPQLTCSQRSHSSKFLLQCSSGVCAFVTSWTHREDFLPVMDNLRRYFDRRRIPLPWSRGDRTENETSPLIPKVNRHVSLRSVVGCCLRCIFSCILLCLKAAKEVSVEAGHVSDQLHQAETNSGHELHDPAWAKFPPRYSYSLTDYFLKYLLVLSNLVFTVLGLLVLGLGMWGLISKQSFAQEKIGSIGTDPMLILLMLGFLLTLLCLSGCVGALRENSTLLRVFSAIVLMLITAQILTTIVAYSVEDQIGGVLRSGMLTAMSRFQDDLDLRFIIDEIQTNLQCCGADDYQDWEINVWVWRTWLRKSSLWLIFLGEGLAGKCCTLFFFFPQILQLLGSRGAGLWSPCYMLRGPAAERHSVELSVWFGSPAAGWVHCSECDLPGGLSGGNVSLDWTTPGPDWDSCHQHTGGPDPNSVHLDTAPGKHPGTQSSK